MLYAATVTCRDPAIPDMLFQPLVYVPEGADEKARADTVAAVTMIAALRRYRVYWEN